MSSVEGMQTMGSVRWPGDVIHEELSDKSVCIIPAVEDTEERCNSKLPHSQAAKGSRREHWGKEGRGSEVPVQGAGRPTTAGRCERHELQVR